MHQEGEVLLERQEPQDQKEIRVKLVHPAILEQMGCKDLKVQLEPQAQQDPAETLAQVVYKERRVRKAHPVIREQLEDQDNQEQLA